MENIEVCIKLWFVRAFVHHLESLMAAFSNTYYFC